MSGFCSRVRGGEGVRWTGVSFSPDSGFHLRAGGGGRGEGGPVRTVASIIWAEISGMVNCLASSRGRLLGLWMKSDWVDVRKRAS